MKSSERERERSFYVLCLQVNNVQSDKVSPFPPVYSTKPQEGQSDILECIIANSHHKIDSWREMENYLFFSTNIEINQAIRIWSKGGGVRGNET